MFFPPVPAKVFSSVSSSGDLLRVRFGRLALPGVVFFSVALLLEAAIGVMTELADDSGCEGKVDA